MTGLEIRLQSFIGSWLLQLSVRVSFSQWFPNRRGLMGGLIFVGFGSGSTIFNQIITVFVNPDNLSPDLAGEDGEK